MFRNKHLAVFTLLLALSCASAQSVNCNGCVDYQYTSGCPNPGSCGFKAINCTYCGPDGCGPRPDWCKLANCTNCMDHMPMDGCPNPGACGFLPPKCKNCDSGPSSDCPKPNWCQTADCMDCMDGMPMDGCPNPLVCGYQPFPCVDCMKGMKMPECPYPDYCPSNPSPSPTTSTCVGCVDGNWTAGCPNPGACNHKPIACNDCTNVTTPGCPRPDWCQMANCTNCMDYMPMDGCSNPGACGFLPPKCKNCDNPTKTDCPKPDWCKVANCWDCMDGMPMENCLNPGVCGFKQISCYGCIPGHKRDGCPYPESNVCGNVTTYPCSGCMDSMPMYPGCPDPGFCGFQPIQCDGCMAGMAMPGCPYPQYCSADDAQGCVMNMYFNMDKNICVLFESWHISNSWQWIVATICMLVLCFLREWLSVYRHLHAKKINHFNRFHRSLLGETRRAPVNSRHKPSPWALHPLLEQFIDSLFYLLSVFFAYIIMLIVMTYNGYIFAVIVLGCFASHFVINYYYSTTPRRYSCCSPEEGYEPGGDAGPDRTVNQKAVVDGDHCCDYVDIDD